MDDCMEMVRHQAELQDADLRVMGIDMQQFIHDGIAKVGAIDSSIEGVVAGEVERAKEGRTVRCDQNHVIDADSTPRVTVILPMPIIVHRSKFGAKVRKINEIRK